MNFNKTFYPSSHLQNLEAITIEPFIPKYIRERQEQQVKHEEFPFVELPLKEQETHLSAVLNPEEDIPYSDLNKENILPSIQLYTQSLEEIEKGPPPGLFTPNKTKSDKFHPYMSVSDHAKLKHLLSNVTRTMMIVFPQSKINDEEEDELYGELSMYGDIKLYDTSQVT